MGRNYIRMGRNNIKLKRVAVFKNCCSFFSILSPLRVGEPKLSNWWPYVADRGMKSINWLCKGNHILEFRCSSVKHVSRLIHGSRERNSIRLPTEQSYGSGDCLHCKGHPNYREDFNKKCHIFLSYFPFKAS